MKSALVCTLLACSAFAGGLEQGVVRVWQKGQKERRPVKAERQPDGAWRYRVKTRDIPRFCTNIDILRNGLRLRRRHRSRRQSAHLQRRGGHRLLRVAVGTAQRHDGDHQIALHFLRQTAGVTP